MLDKARHGTVPLGEKAPRAKHTDDQIRVVKKLLLTKTPTEVSRATGISVHVIENVKYKNKWSHITVDQET